MPHNRAMPFFRRFSCIAFVGVACAPIAAGAQTAIEQTAIEHTAVEQCLLTALRRAPDDATVDSVRRQCEALPQAASPKKTPGASEVAVVPSQVPSQPASPVARRLALEGRAGRFALLPHRPNYIDPLSHAFDAPATSPTDARVQRNEVKFQISFKFALSPPLFDERAALFFAYTGQSWWQAYNRDRSSPFREYSHEPELFASWKPQRRVLGWDWQLASAGFVHQSNGRSGESSRSWNRLFADFRFDRPDGWWLGLRPWWRIPESSKPFPGSPEGDDNPDIERFVGDGELKLGYVGDVHNFTLTMRRSLARSGKGAVQLDWSRPTGFSPDLRWHIQYFDGYGESMLDYQTRVRRLGFGVMLNDWY